MTDKLYVEGIEFLRVVAALRALPSDHFRSLCFHASCFWDNQKFIDKMQAAQIPEDKARGMLQ